MLNIILRTLLMYAIVITSVRVMGKRQVSDMQASELVITLMISEVASLPLENSERPMLSGIIPVLLLAAIEITISLLMMKSRGLRGVICGHPIVIIKDGKLIESELKRLRMTHEDVYTLLRDKDHPDPNGIEYGIVEPNGSLSILTAQDLSNNGVESRDLKDELDKLNDNDPKRGKKK